MRKSVFSALLFLVLLWSFPTFAEDRTYFSTPRWRVELKENQKYLGASRIGLERTCGDVGCITVEEQLEWIVITRLLESATWDLWGADVLNLENLMNNSFLSDGVTQIHWHATPRYSHPIVFAGETFRDSRFGHRLKFSYGQNVSDTILGEIAGALGSYFAENWDGELSLVREEMMSALMP